jgi:hypothetical protein
VPITTKKIRNTQYVYFFYHDEKEGKQKHVCCGSITNPESKKKAIKLELKYLEDQSSHIWEKRKLLKEELLKIN